MNAESLWRSNKGILESKPNRHSRHKLFESQTKRIQASQGRIEDLSPVTDERAHKELDRRKVTLNVDRFTSLRVASPQDVSTELSGDLLDGAAVDGVILSY